MVHLTEHVGLRERSQNGDLITEDLGRGPRDAGSGRIDAIDNELLINSELALNFKNESFKSCYLATSSNVIYCVLENLGGTSGLNNNVESIWVLILELLELDLGILAA